jgi:polyhydroxybutyrate depolymerase
MFTHKARILLIIILFLFSMCFMMSCADSCKDVVCGENEICVNGVCECDIGYAGDPCVNIDECNPNPCQNGGACTDGINEYTCECIEGYTGNSCEILPLPADYLPRPSAGCGNIMAAGLHVFTFEHDGIERTYDLVIPENYENSNPLPLLLNLHPVTMGGPWLHNSWTKISNFNERANQYGYFVVQPDGTHNPAAWNGGIDCCAPPESTVDDVDFISTVIEIVKDQVCVDERRVVAVGMSNGAYLAYRIACEAPDMFAAIAPVVGSLSTELSCVDGRAVSVFAISGSDNLLESREQSVAHFIKANGCGDTTEISYQNGDVTCTTHTDCDDGAEVTHCIVDGGGHCFFGDEDNYLSAVGCAVRNDIVSQDLIWAFLSQRWLP